jgi:hypothetical protein
MRAGKQRKAIDACGAVHMQVGNKPIENSPLEKRIAPVGCYESRARRREHCGLGAGPHLLGSSQKKRMHVRAFVCVIVCVCLFVRVRVCLCVRACMCVFASMSMFMSLCLCFCVRACI